MKRLLSGVALALMITTAIPTMASAEHDEDRDSKGYNDRDYRNYRDYKDYDYRNYNYRDYNYRYRLDREKVAVAAHELDDAAKHFYKLVDDLKGYSHLSKDAREFANDADRFHERVESGTRYRNLADDFQRLRYAYFHLQDQLRYTYINYNYPNHYDHRRSHNKHVARDWRRVEEAWQRLDRTVRNGFYSYNRYHDRYNNYPGRSYGWSYRSPEFED